MADVDNLLSTLRGEEPVLEAPPALEAPPFAAGEPPALAAPDPALTEELLAPLQQRIEELERRLEEQAAPPPMEEPAPPLEPPPNPPSAPTELHLFLQTRMELLEKKLEMASAEALRANMILREREQAQRKAQGEVEDLFRNMRQQQREVSYDKLLRRQLSAAQLRMREMESRLQQAELRMVPAEDVLREMDSEAGREALRRKLAESMGKAETAPEVPVRPSPPTPEQVELTKIDFKDGCVPPGAAAPPEDVFSSPPAAREPGPLDLALVLGRVADLEARLEEARQQREKERQDRRLWEENILSSVKASRRQWQKAGGPELLVEAALETMVDSIRERDELQGKMSATVNALRDEPLDSPEIPRLQAETAVQRRRMEELQEKIGKQMALVQAWVKRDQGGEH